MAEEYTDEAFRKDVRKMVEPLTDRMVEMFVESRSILENHFPKDMPLEQRCDVLTKIIQNQIQSLVNTIKSVDLEKAKQELEKMFKGDLK